MKARFIQDGKYIDYTASADIAAGDVVVIGTIVGVANYPIGNGKKGAIAIDGVFEVDKDANAITVGAAVYWDDANKNVTTTSTSNTAMGKAIAAATAAATTVRVKLG